jgi:hypothetical protein
MSDEPKKPFWHDIARAVEVAGHNRALTRLMFRLTRNMACLANALYPGDVERGREELCAVFQLMLGDPDRVGNWPDWVPDSPAEIARVVAEMSEFLRQASDEIEREPQR